MYVPYEERSCATCKHKVEQVVATSPFVDLTEPYCTFFEKSYVHPVAGRVVENLDCEYAMENWCLKTAYYPTIWERVRRTLVGIGKRK
jgi:hypothetical protein